MEQFNILVCDDDKSIVDAIEIYLQTIMESALAIFKTSC